MTKRKRDCEYDKFVYESEYYSPEFQVNKEIEIEMRRVFLYLENVLDNIERNGESRDIIYIEINKIPSYSNLGFFLSNLMRNMPYSNLENFIRTMTI